MRERTDGERAGEKDILCGDAGAAGEGVEGDAFSKEDFADGAADGGAVFYGLERGSFLDMPFNSVYILNCD